MELKTDYSDDVLNTQTNVRRRYNMITNPDGTVSFEDVTDYDNVGDTFGARDINLTNESIVELDENLTQLEDNFADSNALLNTINNRLRATHGGQSVPFVFGIDAYGNYGYKKVGADSVTPFKNFKKIGTYSANTTVDVSNYGASSVSEFLLVPSATSQVQAEGFRRWATNGNWTLTCYYNPPSMSFANGRVTIYVANAGAYTNSTQSPEEGVNRASFVIPCTLYYIGK